ncbi:MAG: aminotransferase class IV [Desulfitobacteriaceae bacterium]
MNNTTLPADDRLLLFGYGLFETVLITSSGPQLLQSHWQRMKAGAKVLKLSLPDFSRWSQQIQIFLINSPLKPPYALRITLSGGVPVRNQPPQLLLQSRSFPYTTSQYENGIRLYLLPTPRNEYSLLNKIKSTNYLENLLAKEEALHNNADEGIWLNSNKYITEGTMSNIFFVSKQTLFTPSLVCGCLPGTRRSIILELAAKLQIPVFEGSYTQEDLLLADEVFLTNALMGIMPVQRINNHNFNIVPVNHTNSITRFLEQEFNQFIMHYELSRHCTF